MEWVPWRQVGPKRSYKWDWENSELRAQLVPGMILETYDCAYIRVEEITDVGVIAPNIAGDFWDWGKLKAYECIIYRGPLHD